MWGKAFGRGEFEENEWQLGGKLEQKVVIFGVSAGCQKLAKLRPLDNKIVFLEISNNTGTTWITPRRAKGVILTILRKSAKITSSKGVQNAQHFVIRRVEIGPGEHNGPSEGETWMFWQLQHHQKGNSATRRRKQAQQLFCSSFPACYCVDTYVCIHSGMV